MKYDIQFVMPICSKHERINYKQRFLDFKKYGLLNIIKSKCCVDLLIHAEDNFTDEELHEGWPENVVANAILCPLDHVVSKTYFYFSSYLKEITDAKWISKIDDDSTTDVDGLMKNLENDFDYNKEYYIATDLRHDNNDIELDILRELGYDHWLKGKVFHEWEMCIISKAAMNSILNNEISMRLMRRRAEIQRGVNDCCLSIASRIAKIYPIQGYFLSHESRIHEYSIVGGKFNHLHFISHDICPSKYKMLKSIVENPDNQIANFKNKKYLFTRDDAPICYLEFDTHNTLIGAIHDNEKFWSCRDHELIFYNDNCEATTIFQIEKSFDKIKGVFLPDPKVIHKLIKIDLDF